jgi:DNA repair protein RecO (recombination protein O)
MQWNDRAIILSTRRLGESSAIVHVITPEYGLHAGVDRGAFSKAKRGIYQPGNIVEAKWNARLAEQVGSISCELVYPVAAHILDSRHKLAALTSAASLMEKILTERDKQPAVYDGMETFVQALRSGEDWLSSYVRLEFMLLEHAGFGLDLECCAATGQSHDLAYVSPKSGRAVSTDAGKPYHDRLLALPAFLLPNQAASPINLLQILDGVRLCGYFLHERIFAPRGIPVPAVRNRFIQMLQIMKEPVFGEAT